MKDIEEIKQRLDIVEVISSYIPLQKAGRNFKARCPFHAEKTPSFIVFPERQSWHCFGACGTGGDIFSFVMKKENLDFGETLRLLAQKAGVALHETTGTAEDKDDRKRLVEINALAASYYHDLLLHSPEAEAARKYVAGRSLSLQSIKDFQLGFSPNRLDALIKYLLGLEAQEESFVKAGLTVEKEYGGRIDRFRNRLMFPIRDARGNVLGFGARALDDSMPKYLNSPQTLLFDKGSILYGLDRAREAIRKQDLVVIVEGYMDVITAHQYGFNNVVASMGTALTDMQVTILKKLSKKIAFALDADSAGEAATQRGIATATDALDQKVVPVLTPQGAVRFENTLDAEIRVIELPQGDDPDEIIKRDSRQWQSLVENAPPVLDYLLGQVAKTLDMSKPADKSKAVKRLQPLIEEIKDPIRRGHYVQRLARLAGIEEKVLSDALRTYGGETRFGGRKKKTLSRSVVSMSEGSSWEEYCLCLLLRHPELHRHVGKLSSEYFQQVENRQIFEAWTISPSTESLQEELDSPLREHLSMLVEKTMPPMTVEMAENALDGTVLSLRERWLKGKTVLLSEAGPAGDAAEVVEQLQQLGAEKVNAELQQVFELKRRTRPESTA